MHLLVFLLAWLALGAALVSAFDFKNNNLLVDNCPGCAPGDMKCLVNCLGLPNPSNQQALDTNACVQACSEGDPFQAETCVVGCINGGFFNQAKVSAPSVSIPSVSIPSVSVPSVSSSSASVETSSVETTSSAPTTTSTSAPSTTDTASTTGTTGTAGTAKTTRKRPPVDERPELDLETASAGARPGCWLGSVAGLVLGCYVWLT